MPRAAQVARGTLPFADDKAAPLEGHRSVLVTVGDRTVFSRALPVGAERQVVELQLVPADFHGDFLKVTIRYSGSMINDWCINLQRANDRFTVRPETALRLTIARGSLERVDSGFGLMPQKVAIGVPERRLSARETAAEISAIRLFKGRGRIVDVVPLADLLARSIVTSPV